MARRCATFAPKSVSRLRIMVNTRSAPPRNAGRASNNNAGASEPSLDGQGHGINPQAERVHVDANRSAHWVATAGDVKAAFDAGIAGQAGAASRTNGVSNKAHLVERAPLELSLGPHRGAERPIVRVSSGPAGQPATMTVASGGSALIFDDTGGATIANAAEGIHVTLTPHAPQHLQIPPTKLTIRWQDQASLGAVANGTDKPPLPRAKPLQHPRSAMTTGNSPH